MASRKKKPASKVGRPPEEVPAAMAERLVKHIYEGGSIYSFGKLKDTPSVRTLYYWFEKDEEFSAQVKRANRHRGSILMEQALEIADDSSQDTEVRETKGGDKYEVPDREWMGRSKLRIEQRVRMAACLDHDWSQKQKVEHSVDQSLVEKVRAARKRVLGE